MPSSRNKTVIAAVYVLTEKLSGIADMHSYSVKETLAHKPDRSLSNITNKDCAPIIELLRKAEALPHNVTLLYYAGSNNYALFCNNLPCAV